MDTTDIVTAMWITCIIIGIVVGVFAGLRDWYKDIREWFRNLD